MKLSGKLVLTFRYIFFRGINSFLYIDVMNSIGDESWAHFFQYSDRAATNKSDLVYLLIILY